MKTVNDLLKILGGTRPAARALGLPPTTVSNWRLIGLPTRNVMRVYKCLKKLDVNVTLEQLLNLAK